MTETPTRGGIVFATAAALLVSVGAAGCGAPISDANELEARIESSIGDQTLEARCGHVESETWAGGLPGIDAYEARVDYYACVIADLDTIVHVDGGDWNIILARTCTSCRWRSPESLLNNLSGS